MSNFGTGSQIGPAGELTVSEEAIVTLFDGLSTTDGNFIVGDGITWLVESGSTARASLSLVIGTDVQAFNQTLQDIASGATTVGSGDVVGPSSSVNNAIVRFDGTTGKTIQDYTSGAPTISDTGNVIIGQALGVTGTITGPSGTWDSGGMDIATSDSYAVAGTDVLTATTLGSGVVNSSLDSVDALNSGSITSGFGNINNGSSTLDTGALNATTMNASDLVSLTDITATTARTTFDMVTFDGDTLTTGNLIVGTNVISGSALLNRSAGNNLVDIDLSRTETRTGGTTADDFDVVSISRTAVMNGSGGTMTAAGSVLKLEHISTQSLGTLTDSTNVLEIVQDSGSTGAAIQVTLGIINVDDTTASTSGTTGSIHTDGGLGVTLDLFVAGSINVVGDVAANDLAAIGHTTVDGLILIGQGSTNDVSIRNDTDAVVLRIPTGTSTMVFGVDNTVSSFILTEKASIALDPAGGADGDYSGITFTATGGVTVAFGEMVYLVAGDSQWDLTDADAVATGGTVAIAMAVSTSTAGNPITLMTHGIVRADAVFPALTIGAPVYLSTTPGAITLTAPSGTDDVIRIIGYAITADEILLTISPDHLTAV